jgi:tetratricopeptide (TPR) repeat protein
VTAALEIDEKTKDKHSIAWDRFRRAQIARCRGEYTQAALEFEDCLEMFRGMNAPFGEAWCIYELGRVALATEEFHDASAYFERALAIFRVLGSGNAWATLQLGSTAAYEGRFRTAGKLLQKSLTAFRENGPRSGLLRALTESARLARLQGDVETAQSLVAESLGLAAEIDSKILAVAALQQAAYLAKNRGSHEICARFLGKVDALREDMGSPIEPCNQAEYSGAVDTARNALGEEAFSKLVRQGRVAPLSALFEGAAPALLSPQPATPSAAPPSD